MLTTWNTQCGIAEYSRGLVEALQAGGVEMVVLGSRNYDERAVAADEDYVVPCFDVEPWNRHGHRELDVERILGLDLDVLHVQYQLGLYNVPRLVELLERFDGASVITWHDNWVPIELEAHRFDAAITHRLGVGPTDLVIPHGVRNVPPIVRTFGLGRTREEVIAPICERNGWTFESAATSEAAFGGQPWVPWRQLHDWLRGADAIVLWYEENELVGASGAAHTALATRRPLIVNDFTWFADLPQRSGPFHKLDDDPALLEATLREVLDNPLVTERAWETVAQRHLDCYRDALSASGARAAQGALAPPAPPAPAAPTGGVEGPSGAPPPAAQADPSSTLEPISAAAAEEWRSGDVGHLHRAFDLTSLPIVSHRRLWGRIVVALKRRVRRLLFPVLEVQTSVNAANARVASFLLEQLAAQSRSIAELDRRLAAGAAGPTAAVPIPPEPLIRRSGWTPGTDVVSRYLTDGLAMKELLADLVADRPGRLRVLDFGCGVAKTLRHFALEVERFELFGCDIDGASIDWLEQHHSSYASFARVQETPGLPWPDGHFDLVYAVSVFTHVTDEWASWLLELRRVLKPDGLLVATVLGAAMIEVERGGLWEEDSIGMNVLRHGQDWEGGGPTVFHSHWWIREHWGRAFEILEIRDGSDPDGTQSRGAHDLVIMRPRAASLTREQLEALDPGEPREIRALQRNIAQLHADDADLRQLLLEARARGDAEHDQRVLLARELDAVHAELEQLRREGARLA
jgi:SAM-dependent methyltransferase